MCLHSLSLGFVFVPVFVFLFVFVFLSFICGSVSHEHCSVRGRWFVKSKRPLPTTILSVSMWNLFYNQSVLKVNVCVPSSFYLFLSPFKHHPICSTVFFCLFILCFYAQCAQYDSISFNVHLCVSICYVSMHNVHNLHNTLQIAHGFCFNQRQFPTSQPFLFKRSTSANTAVEPNIL